MHLLRAATLVTLFAASAWAADAAVAGALPTAAAAAQPGRAPLTRASDGLAGASAETTHVARWVAHSRDNGGRPYLIIDKANATVFAFKGDGTLLEAKPALLGIAIGDGTAKGIGNRSLASIRAGDRTTPAGRFIASLDHDPKGDEVLWIDYEAAIALHAVVKGKPAEHRAQRLLSATTQDNRISFGCINVPGEFYRTVVSPLFTGTDGIVYVLPETSPASTLFGSYEVDASGRAVTAAASAR